MPERRLPIRQIKEVLRLHHEAHLSERQIADVCKIGKGTVQRYLERAGAAQLSWPLPEPLDNAGNLYFADSGNNRRRRLCWISVGTPACDPKVLRSSSP